MHFGGTMCFEVEIRFVLKVDESNGRGCPQQRQHTIQIKRIIGPGAQTIILLQVEQSGDDFQVTCFGNRKQRRKTFKRSQRQPSPRNASRVRNTRTLFAFRSAMRSKSSATLASSNAGQKSRHGVSDG